MSLILSIISMILTHVFKEAVRYLIDRIIYFYRYIDHTNWRKSTKRAFRLLILGGGFVITGVLFFRAISVLVGAEMCVAGLVILLLGVWNLLHRIAIPKVTWRGDYAVEEDRRHISNKIGPGEHETILSTATFRGRDYWVNRSFVELILSNNYGLLTYQQIVERYMIDKYSKVARRDRLDMMHNTCYVAYQCLQYACEQRRELHENCTAEARAAGFYVSKPGHYAKEVSKHPWLILCFWVLFIGASGALSARAETFLKSVGQHFNPDTIAAPRPLRDGVRIVSGIRTKAVKTFSTALAHEVPRMRNQEFDRHDPDNVYAAMRYRLAVKNPTPIYDPNMTRIIEEEVEKLARMYNREEFPPVDPDDIPAVHRWIDSRPYTDVRKKQLHKAADIPESEKRKFREPFLKNETYQKLNKPRTIVAANDEIKVRLGPIFEGLNNWFSHMPFSVKHMTPQERVDYLRREFNGTRFFATDHTSFEVSFIRPVQEMFEQKFYRKVIEPQYWDDLDTLMEPLRLIHRETGTLMTCPAIRCSGEMNTSLGNTISNYLSIQVAARLLNSTVKCVVEGDDSLIEVPEDLSKADYQHVMERMGFNIKIEEFRTANEAGFCHLHWDENGKPVQEVIPRLPDLFWGDNSSLRNMTRDELLEAKLTSLSCDDGQTPCLWKFFKGGRRVADLDSYHAERYHALRSGHNYTILAEQGTCPDLVHRSMFSVVDKLSLEDQILIESMGLDLNHTVSLMYQCSNDMKFVQDMYCLQVDED